MRDKLIIGILIILIALMIMVFVLSGNTRKEERKTSTISVFGTEYNAGDNGTIFLQLLDGNKNPIHDAFCQITVYYPDKTKWIDNLPLTYLEKGIYYSDIFIPDILGIYIINAYCYYSDIRYKFDLPYVVLYDGSLEGDYPSDDPELVQNLDCAFIKTKESTYNEFRFNDTELGNINLSNIDSIDLIWAGQHEETASLQVWNFTSSTWITVGETQQKTMFGECYKTQIMSRTITSGFNDLVYNHEIRFRISVPTTKKIYTDMANIIFHNNGSIIETVRGSGEIHVINMTHTLTNLTTESSWYEIKYVAGTEYISGSQGVLAVQFLRIVSGTPTPINNGICNVSVYFPNKTIFLNKEPMTYLENSNGIYYLNFTVPMIEGVYVSDYSCFKPPNIRTYSSGSFHVSNAGIFNATEMWQYPNRTLTNFTNFWEYITGILNTTNPPEDPRMIIVS